MRLHIQCAALLFLLPLSSAAQIENPDALKPFFRALNNGKPVHVLQYGDSHTASDDWVDTMRRAFQTDGGNGGPGFVTAGHLRGYRRFDVTSTNSAGWTVQGTVGKTGDNRNGLSGISLTANRPGETITITTAADQLQVVFLKQPGGGDFSIDSNTVRTNGPFETGFYQIPTDPGPHTYTVTTKSYSPVRIFGWIADNNNGITWETLGINGAQVRMMNGWDQKLWSEQIQARDPALVVLAYGTNEALYPRFTAEEYKVDLAGAVTAIKRAVPDAAILMISPPEDSRRRPFPHLQEVIGIQREIARQYGCAFWNWTTFMIQSGRRARWVDIGLSQPDYVHLTAAGYQLLGQTLAHDLQNAGQYPHSPISKSSSPLGHSR